MARRIRHLGSFAHRWHAMLGERRRSAVRADRKRRRFESLEPRVVLAVDPLIYEFQAINSTTLQDEDGDFSDWIEIRNPGTDALDVSGWYLTDDTQALTKWRFPNGTIIDGEEELIVFASDKNRTDSMQALHTNFKLSGDGEFLAIVKPDGTTISQAFNPYPAQREDQSYGLAVDHDIVSLIGGTSAAKAFVPTDDSLGSTWTLPDFDDSLWQSGTTALGYEELVPGFEENETFDAPLGASWTVDIPPTGTSIVNVAGGALHIMVPARQTMTSADRGIAPVVFRDVPVDAINYEIVTKVAQGADRGAAGIVVMDAHTGRPGVFMEYDSRLRFQLVAGDTRLGSVVKSGQTEYSLRLVRDGFDRTWTGYYRLNDADDWIEVGVATDGFDDTPVIDDPRIGLFGRTGTSKTMSADFDHFNLIVPDQPPIYGPHIGLDVEASMYNVNPSVYLRIPFSVDDDPSKLDKLALSARFDDGFIAYLNGTELAADNGPLQSRWDSSALASFGAASAEIPTRRYTNSPAIDAIRQGENVLAVHVMNQSKDDLDLFFDAKLFALDELEKTEEFFVVPTPGASNDLPAAPTPVIGQTDGVFFGTTTVTIEMPEPNPILEIRYTTDGSVPTPDSWPYLQAITLDESAMLQAKAFDPFDDPIFAPSSAATGTFTAVDPVLESVSSKLPLLVLDSLGERLPPSGSSTLVPMNVVLFDTSHVDGRSHLGSDRVDYVGRGGARDRGSSSSGQSKPNMAFETWGKSGTTQDDDEPAGLLGMAPDSDWILHAPYSFDRVAIRNQLAFSLSEAMGDWAVEFRHVEVYLNRDDGLVTQDDYAGLYVMMEKVQQGPDRVDVTAIDRNDRQEPEISGGYIWKIDRSDPDAPGFSAGGQTIQWVYPKSPVSRTARADQKATFDQQNWVRRYFDNFSKTLKIPDIHDPEGYSKYIDPVSWVDQHMLNMFMMNVDALRLSTYLYKDRGGRVEFGPPWDFDRSSESNDNRDDDPFHWDAPAGGGTSFFSNDSQEWWGDLFRDPGFWQLYVDRWQSWRDGPLSDEAVERLIRSLVADVYETQIRNLEKWAQSQPRNTSDYENNVLDGTYDGEVNNLVAWMKDRAAFIDSNFAHPVDVTIGSRTLDAATGARVVVGQSVEIRPPLRPIAIDTPLIDGHPGAASAAYLVLGDDTLGDTWTAIDFDDRSWQSGPLGIGFAPDNIAWEAFNNTIQTEVVPNEVVLGSTTVLTRIEFEVADVQQARSNDLILQMMYDDGFVAYLNGTKIREENVRNAARAWNERAVPRTVRNATTSVPFNVSRFADLLVEGTNVLAVRLVNSTSTSDDLLLQPELISRETVHGVNPDSKIYYTIDGTDPRGPDGNPTANAQLLVGGGTITVEDSTRLIVRNYDDSYRGLESGIVLTDWSSPRQYDLVVSGTPLVISEINYNPPQPTASELALQGPLAEGEATWSSADFEFIEIRNVASTSTSLVGVKLTDGVEFDFYNASVSSIDGGERVVLVSNPEAFAARYGPNARVIGQFTGELNNGGEDIDLRTGTGDILFSVKYADSDPWPTTADGMGATLEWVGDGVASSRQGKWYSWRSSTEFHGTPGTAGVGPVGVVINEIVANADPSANAVDAIELYNTSDADMEVGGWFLSDSRRDLFAFEIPAGTTIPAGGFVVFREGDFNAPNAPGGFGLSANGESVYLVQGSRASGVHQFVADVEFRGTRAGESLGRIPNGNGRLTPLTNNSLGSVNADPRVGPLVISEVQYDPSLSAEVKDAFPLVQANALEFVEVHNTSPVEIDLTNWRLRGGTDYDFDAGTRLAPGESIIVLQFDPADSENVNELNAFQLTYGVGSDVRWVGGYKGRLNNSDDTLVLLRPESGVGDDILRSLEDEVLYDNQSPWPVNANGTERSIQRRLDRSLGNNGNSWFSGPPTPGSILESPSGDMDNNGVVDGDDINAMSIQMRNGNPDLRFDLNDDTRVDEEDRDILVYDQIGTTYGDANLDYVFDSSDLVAAMIAGEYEDSILGNSLWQTGDWNGDGEFDADDLLFVLVTGDYADSDSKAGDPGVNEGLMALAVQPSDNKQRLTRSHSETSAAEPSIPRRAVIRAVDPSVESLFDSSPYFESDAVNAVTDALIDDGLGAV